MIDEARLVTDTERQLIGSLIAAPDWIAFVSDQLSPADFYRPAFAILFRLLTELSQAGAPIDATTFPLDAISRLPSIDTYIERHELIELADDVPITTAVPSYVEHVREAAKRRRARLVLRQALDKLDHPTERADEVASEASGALIRATTSEDQDGGWRSLGSAGDEVLDRIERIARGEIKGGGMLSGLHPLDVILGGLQPGDFAVIGARPAMGKTAMAMQIAEHVAATEGDVGYFSLEMPRAQLAGRRIASHGRVSVERIRDGRLTSDERARIAAARLELHRFPVWIDDDANQTAEKLARRLHTLWSYHEKLRLVVVDYIQLMQGDDRQSRENVVAAISRTLKECAKRFGIAVVGLAQLNRGLEQRKDKRPVLGDLRESGAIEQDADQVVFLYRHEVYEPDDAESHGKAEAIVAKNRNGPTGTAHLRWLGWQTRFEAPAPVVGALAAGRGAGTPEEMGSDF